MRTVAELSGALRSGEITSRWLAERFLDEEAACRDEFHPFVSVDPERVLDEADRADRERVEGRDRGPLHGILVGIKDIIDVEGYPTRGGSPLTSDDPAVTDATVVQRLRAAGAVIAGKTTTHELACGVVSAPASNPWDPGRVPGGSSGGSGVAVAAGLVPIALGSDTGGSIRIPAALCGTAGHKPTYGLVPVDGVMALSVSLDHLGPLGITVADCAIALDVLTGGGTGAMADLDGGIAGWRIGVLDSGPFAPMQDAVAAGLERSIAAGVELGATVETITIDELDHVLAVEFGIILGEAYELHRDALRDRPEDIDPAIRGLLIGGAVFPSPATNRAHAARTVIARAIAAAMDEHQLDVLLAPTLPATAAAKDHPEQPIGDGIEHIGMSNVRTTAPFNVSGQPAVAVPCGFDANGLPVGVQLAARAGADAVALRAAHALERLVAHDHNTMGPAAICRDRPTGET
jgi:aspartyl-tRNA(Asn)/glutamyl-tRNA(Gln) amidotransferase subunit A